MTCTSRTPRARRAAAKLVVVVITAAERRCRAVVTALAAQTIPGRSRAEVTDGAGGAAAFHSLATVSRSGQASRISMTSGALRAAATVAPAPSVGMAGAVAMTTSAGWLRNRL